MERGNDRCLKFDKIQISAESVKFGLALRGLQDMSGCELAAELIRQIDLRVKLDVEARYQDRCHKFWGVPDVCPENRMRLDSKYVKKAWKYKAEC